MNDTKREIRRSSEFKSDYKKLVGGNYMAIVNPAIPAALNWLGVTAQGLNNKKGSLILDTVKAAP